MQEWEREWERERESQGSSCVSVNEKRNANEKTFHKNVSDAVVAEEVQKHKNSKVDAHNISTLNRRSLKFVD